MDENLKGIGESGKRQYDRLTIILKRGDLKRIKDYCRQRGTSMTGLITLYIDRLLEAEDVMK